MSAVTISGLQLRWGDTRRVTVSGVRDLYGVPIAEDGNVLESQVGGHAPRDLRIMKVSPESIRLRRPRPVRVAVTVHNNGTQEANRVRVRLRQGRKVIEVKTIRRLRPDEQAVVHFTLRPVVRPFAMQYTWRVEVKPLPEEQGASWENWREVSVFLQEKEGDEPFLPPPPTGQTALVSIPTAGARLCTYH